MPSVNYPLQSPAAGVSVLEAQQQAEFAQTSSGTSDQGSGAPLRQVRTPVPPSTSPASPPSDTTTTDPSNATTTTAPSDPPIVDVTLDSVSTSLSSYTLTDGSVVDAAALHLHRNGTNSDGSTYSGPGQRWPLTLLRAAAHLVIRRYKSRRTHPLLTNNSQSED